jgi:hypothetical protein
MYLIATAIVFNLVAGSLCLVMAARNLLEGDLALAVLFATLTVGNYWMAYKLLED